MKKITIGIPIHNAIDVAEKTIQLAANACIANNYDFQIIVVDDNSDQNTKNILSRLISYNKNIHIYHTEDYISNPSPNLAWNDNFILNNVRDDDDYCLILESDVWIINSTIPCLIEGFNTHDNISAVLSAQLNPDRKTVNWANGVWYENTDIKDIPKELIIDDYRTNIPIGCALLRGEIARNPKIRIDETFTLWSCDDDFWHNLRYETNTNILCYNKSKVVHIAHKSSPAYNDSFLKSVNNFYMKWGKKINIRQESKLAHKYLDGLQGIEIGASVYNPFGLNTINLPIDAVTENDNLPFDDNSCDFIVSSHVLEYIYDPIKALREWHRVVKPNGYMYLTVSHKERTVDINLPRTGLTELISRYNSSTDNKSPNERWNVWITKDIMDLIEYLGFEIVEIQDLDDKFGDGSTFIIKVNKYPSGETIFKYSSKIIAAVLLCDKKKASQMVAIPHIANIPRIDRLYINVQSNYSPEEFKREYAQLINYLETECLKQWDIDVWRNNSSWQEKQRYNQDQKRLIPIASSRNMAIDYAMCHEDCTHLLFVDDDVIIEKNGLDNLLSLNLDICGGLVSGRGAHSNLQYVFGKEREDSKRIFCKHGTCGYMLLSRNIINNLRFRWGISGHIVAEDPAYCTDAVKLGYNQFVIHKESLGIHVDDPINPLTQEETANNLAYKDMFVKDNVDKKVYWNS